MYYFFLTQDTRPICVDGDENHDKENDFVIPSVPDQVPKDLSDEEQKIAQQVFGQGEILLNKNGNLNNYSFAIRATICAVYKNTLYIVQHSFGKCTRQTKSTLCTSTIKRFNM